MSLVLPPPSQQSPPSFRLPLFRSPRTLNASHQQFESAHHSVTARVLLNAFLAHEARNAFNTEPSRICASTTFGAFLTCDPAKQ